MTVFTVLVVLGLAAGGWLMIRVRRLPPPMHASRDATETSVIVPARDEAQTLPALLTSLRCLDHRPGEILVIDDASRDRTAAVASAHGATVVRVTEPRPGWTGKSWACSVGAAHAAGRNLLFLDADTRLAPDALDRLLTAHHVHGGLVTVQPHHETVRPYEELSAYCNVVAFMGTGAFTPRARVARAAFGSCLLTSVDDYRRVGGHAAVRDQIAEDVHLAHAYRRAGLPVTCFAGAGDIRFRMYPAGLAQLWEGWSKNLAAGASGADRTAVSLTVLWVCANIAIGMRAGAEMVQWMLGGVPLAPATVFAWAVATAELRWMMRRVGSFRWWTALAFPIPLAAFICLFARSLAWTFVRRRVTWRGREIAVGTGRV
jgi:4,4'-diaponeurosporenoate glycosyltransferase